MPCRLCVCVKKIFAVHLVSQSVIVSFVVVVVVVAAYRFRWPKYIHDLGEMSCDGEKMREEKKLNGKIILATTALYHVSLSSVL